MVVYGIVNRSIFHQFFGTAAITLHAISYSARISPCCGAGQWCSCCTSFCKDASRKATARQCSSGADYQETKKCPRLSDLPINTEPKTSIMVSFFLFPAPAFALSNEYKTDDLQELDLADILTSEFLEEDEEDRKHKEEYWGLSIQGQPSSVPLSRPPSAAPYAIASTLTFSSTSVTVNPPVLHPLPVWSPQKEDRDNEMEPVASGSPSVPADLRECTREEASPR
ncbi:hypothetical protein B0H21DRAFT_85306 [Amylocystis lapponica]|nr:hypothetical protein B0H21DRAFT_85306 [Amylocystis lapponica]